MTDVVVFLDAMADEEAKGIFNRLKQGNMDSGSPRVTPRIMSSIYSGENVAGNGMMEVSKYGGSNVTRPKKSTFIDRSVREGLSVLCMGMPFCAPFHETNGDCVLHGTSLSEQYAVPEDRAGMVTEPEPQADPIKSHPDRVYASYLDYTQSYFTRFKENIRHIDPDVAFIGYNLIDSYCHFQHTEERQGKSYRQHLIDEVAALCDRIAKQIDGDLMFFSDHGQTELTDVFRVNRWLKEKGYLDYKVDYDFIDTLNEYQGENHPGAQRVENQVTFGQPGVKLDKESSQVVCADQFDSCMTLLTDPADFDAEAFRDDLLSTGLYRSVGYRWEKYDDGADYYDTVPHILPDRAEGVFVSGNLHKNPIGMGYYRTGVHDYTACYGATCDLNVPEGKGRHGYITPEQMHDVICDFIGLETNTAPVTKDDMKSYTSDELELINSNLEEML